MKASTPHGATVWDRVWLGAHLATMTGGAAYNGPRNPGTSPIASILTAMNLACVMFRLTAAETLRGVTVNAARALGLSNDRGTLQVGARADLAIWRLRHPEQLCAEVGVHRPVEIVLAGRASA